jgi:hypothetical protein
MTAASVGRAGLLGGLGLLVLFALARGPLHRATFSLPVSNDDAIPLLMARHLLRGELATTLWNQPYNGALDAYLLAPGLLLARAHDVFRAYEVLCAALLVLLVFLLARELAGRRAGFTAAALAAVGTPYMALMTATGPPPNFLMPLVTGFPLLVALRRLPGGQGPLRSPGPGAAFLVGLVCGLAVWNSSLAIPAFVGMGAGLLLAGARLSLRDRGPLGAWAAGALLGASPLLLARALGAAGSSVVTAASAVTAIRPPRLWGAGLHDLGRALAGLLGLEVPLVVDGPERAVPPLLLRLVLTMALVVLLFLGCGTRRAFPLLGWAAALAGAFALSRRTGPDELRYLYGLNAPLLALLGAGLAPALEGRRSVGLALSLGLVVPWGVGHHRLSETWRVPSHAVRVWQVPPLEPVLDSLRRAQVESAYASLQFAGRLGLESEGRVLASQAWNERIPGDPLRFRDEVDLDPRAAWVLSPHLSRGMPRAGGFRELLRELGGGHREDIAGDLVVFRAFRPPYDEARPVDREAFEVGELGGRALDAAARDRDPTTAWVAANGLRPGAGLEVRLAEARRLDALVLAVDLEASPLAVPWVAEIDGGRIVARGPARQGLQWVNGAPRAARQALLAVTLGQASTTIVRLIFQGAGPPLRVHEVFLYGPDEAERPTAGREAAEEALRAARAGHWQEAVALYERAVRAEPERASHHAAFLRSRWRSTKRQRVDVESLPDGGPALVGLR